MDEIDLHQKRIEGRRREVFAPGEKTDYEKSLTPDKIARMHEGKPIRVIDFTTKKAPPKKRTRRCGAQEVDDKITGFIAKNPASTVGQISAATAISESRVRGHCVAMVGGLLRVDVGPVGKKRILKYSLL